MSSASPTPAPRTFRLPRSAYLIVLFLLFCTVPLAFGDNTVESLSELIGLPLAAAEGN